MNWVSVIRGLRGAAWSVAAAWGIYGAIFTSGRILKLEMSAPQAAAYCAQTLVEMMALYIAIRAIDTVLELRERSLIEKRATSSVAAR